MNITPLKRVVIVGGGTAGWITAGTLSAKWRDKGISITLVESPNVPIIGVGEGTWPTMRKTLQDMGVRETDFVRECSVAFKQGWKYARWLTGAEQEYYYHPLELPAAYHDQDLAPAWLEGKNGRSFSKSVCPQEEACEMGLGPKAITTAEYQGIANYAYHLDAGAFAEFLKRHCVEKLGVTHVLDDVVGIEVAPNDDIAALSLKGGTSVAGDLFVDCTGMRALLLGQHFGVGFRSCRKHLFVDTALALHAPYPSDDAPIASPTISTAQDAGWIWDIGLPQRRGIGYVYSSSHSSEEHALEQLRAYLQPDVADPDALEHRKIEFDPGHRETFWHRNVVAIGLSAGFLEPLEASSLLLVEISSGILAEQLPANRNMMDIVARRFNETLGYHWSRIIDFLKLHYVLSRRTEKFWVDNRVPESIPERLQELRSLWEHQLPWRHDLPRATEVYSAASYQYILYGMEYRPVDYLTYHGEQERRIALRHFDATERQAQHWSRKLPQHRELIDQIRAYGMSTV